MWFPDQQHWLHHQGASEKCRDSTNTESETAGRGQLSVIPVTTRPEHSLSALNASSDLLIGSDQYAPNPSSPANEDDRDQGKLSEGFNHATQVESLSTPSINE